MTKQKGSNASDLCNDLMYFVVLVPEVFGLPEAKNISFFRMNRELVTYILKKWRKRRWRKRRRRRRRRRRRKRRSRKRRRRKRRRRRRKKRRSSRRRRRRRRSSTPILKKKLSSSLQIQKSNTKGNSICIRF
ncbi:hypothetical protein FHG87_022741 [Trinorchestia longiramus]|nr:hypothetical protein FHG87_022741 [Trinorchestia longiramus]